MRTKSNGKRKSKNGTSEPIFVGTPHDRRQVRATASSPFETRVPVETICSYLANGYSLAYPQELAGGFRRGDPGSGSFGVGRSSFSIIAA